MSARAYAAAGLVIGVLVVLIVLQATAPPYSRDTMTCIANVYNLNMAMHMYADMAGGRFPPANRWVDALQTTGFVVDPRTLRCPRDRSGARCSYGMNAALSEAEPPLLRDDIVTLYEDAHPGDNPAGGPKDVSYPPRHRDGNVYALANFTVRPVSPPPKFGP